jgi:hypothetical protein
VTDIIEPATVAAASRAKIVFFIARSLLKMAPWSDAGLKDCSHAVTQTTVSIKSAEPSIERNKRAALIDGKNGLFQAVGRNTAGKG